MDAETLRNLLEKTEAQQGNQSILVDFALALIQINAELNVLKHGGTRDAILNFDANRKRR
jgi:hypothetical protein